jgi:hypothetical protein
MPEISRFLGMVVSIYYKEHAPPHFHVNMEAKEGLFQWCWNGRFSIGTN